MPSNRARVDLPALAEKLRALGLTVDVGPDSIEVLDPWIVVFGDGEVQPGMSRIAPNETVTWRALALIRDAVGG